MPCYDLHFYPIIVAELSSTCNSYKPEVLKHHVPALCLNFTPIHCAYECIHEKFSEKLTKNVMFKFAEGMDGFKIAT